MKANIEYDSLWHMYSWNICYNNGAVATFGPHYTRRDNAIRGLTNFLKTLDKADNIWKEYWNYDNEKSI